MSKAAVVVAAVSFGWGCSDSKHEPARAPDSETRPLNELSTEEQRVFLKGYPGDWRKDTDKSKDVSEPPADKPAPDDAKRIDLVPPDEFEFREVSTQDAIGARRSVREFSDAPLTLKELSFLLWATQGITGSNGGLPLRAAPSGGARYPFETYVAVNRVEGLASGVYRYLVSHHQLVLLRNSDAISDELTTACYGQQHVGDAAVTFAWAAIPERTEWQYAYLSPKLIAVEAGHICQNLYLASGAIQAGCCALLAYDQASVDRLIEVDGTDEFVVYAGCVGKLPTAK